MSNTYSFLLYRGNDEIKIEMIRAFLEKRMIPYYSKSGSAGGIYNALSFAEDSFIYIKEEDSNDIIIELEHLDIL